MGATSAQSVAHQLKKHIKERIETKAEMCDNDRLLFDLKEKATKRMLRIKSRKKKEDKFKKYLKRNIHGPVYPKYFNDFFKNHNIAHHEEKMMYINGIPNFIKTKLPSTMEPDEVRYDFGRRYGK